MVSVTSPAELPTSTWRMSRCGAASPEASATVADEAAAEGTARQARTSSAAWRRKRTPSQGLVAIKDPLDGGLGPAAILDSARPASVFGQSSGVDFWLAERALARP